MKEKRPYSYSRWSVLEDEPWSWQLPIPFLEKKYPFRIFVYLKLVEKILPEELFKLFRSDFKKWLWKDFFTDLGTQLGVELRYGGGAVPHGMGSSFRLSKVAVVEGEKERTPSYGRSLISDDEALSKSLGEFLERYICRTTNGVRMIPVRPAFSKRFLEASPLYESWQKQEVNSTLITRSDIPSTRLKGVIARSLLTGRKEAVPAARIFFGDKTLCEPGTLNEPSSNGGGGGFTREQATLSGWYELIERDGFMCHWLLGLVPDRVDAETVPFDSVRTLIESARMFGAEVYFLDVTTAIGVSSICAVVTVRDQSGKISVGVGCSAGHDLRKIFENSLLEALIIARVLSVRALENETTFDASILKAKPFSERKVNKDLRSHMWGGGFIGEKIQPFIAGPVISFAGFIESRKPKVFANEREELASLKDLFKTLIGRYGEGYHPYVYEATSKLLRRYGYFVSKVVVASLFPLYLTEHMATLDVSALQHWKDTARANGRKDDSLHIVNTTPHPFL